MPDEADAEILQVVCGQLWQHCGVDRVVAKRLFVLLQPEVPEPRRNVHARPPDAVTAAVIHLNANHPGVRILGRGLSPPKLCRGSCCDSYSNSPLAAREDRTILTPSASPLPFQLLERTLEPFRASARKCLIRSIGSWHCCPAAVLDDQPSVPSRGLLELRQFCWRIGLRIEFLDTDRCEHVNDCSFRSLFRHSLRSAAERPSENRETEH